MRNKKTIQKIILKKLYLEEKLSLKQISKKFNCSSNKILFWMKKYKIKRRTKSESMYVFKNPKGDPFLFLEPKTKKDYELYGMGIGLYWGEGTKANKYSIRLGNTDPKLIATFIKFLEKFFSINKKDLSFGLQLFTDLSSKKVVSFWSKELKVSKKQFMKTIITESYRKGNYTNKIKHGVLTVYFNNVKARNILNSLIENIKKKV